ncbi:MAG: LamG domain-containing protein, partial [Phycisphaerales bacterium]
WKLDETEGEIAYDSAAVNDAVVIGSPLWLPAGGMVDGAILLDGVDDSVIAGPVLNPSDGPFSVFAWVQGGVPGQTVISQVDGADWLGTDPLDGALVTELEGPGRVGSPLQSQTVITDGNWHRIGLVWDGLNRALYVDDVPVAQDTQAGLRGSAGGLNIGTGKAMAAGTFFSGLIDDVRIYNRAVSP